MKKTIKTGIIQQRKTADRKQNQTRLADAARRLSAAGAELIVNQELHDSFWLHRYMSVVRQDCITILQ